MTTAQQASCSQKLAFGARSVKNEDLVWLGSISGGLAVA
jgi:hypothetical protein